jgi:hypothetical protein
VLKDSKVLRIQPTHSFHSTQAVCNEHRTPTTLLIVGNILVSNKNERKIVMKIVTENAALFIKNQINV